jgi:hypothetical protein
MTKVTASDRLSFKTGTPLPNSFKKAISDVERSTSGGIWQIPSAAEDRIGVDGPQWVDSGHLSQVESGPFGC